MQKEIPAQILASSSALRATIVLASFGDSSESFSNHVFNLKIENSNPAPSPATPQRYGKLQEIHHIFRADPKNPPVVISVVFTFFVFDALLFLLGGVSFSVSSVNGANWYIVARTWRELVTSARRPLTFTYCSHSFCWLSRRIGGHIFLIL
jgi:hypothetical protein